MEDFYYVVFGDNPPHIFEDVQDEEYKYELSLERARYVRDHIINPAYKPRIVKGNPVS